MAVQLNRRVVRQTSAAIRSRGADRLVIVELEQGGNLLWLRLKGQKTRYPLTYAELYIHACRIHLAAEKKRKALERAAKRKERAA